MTRSQHSWTPILLALILALPSCIGTDTGNPPVTATLTARSGDPMVVVSPSDGEVIVTEGWVSIPQIRFVLGASCDHASDIVATELVGDVVRGVSTLFPEDTVCGIHVSPGPPAVLPDGAPEALGGRSLLVRGIRADATAFEITNDSTIGVDVVSGTDDITLTPEGDILLAFDVAVWLEGVDLAAIPIDTDGVARLGPGDAGAASVTLGRSIAVYADVGGDGRVGPAEEATGPIAVSHVP